MNFVTIPIMNYENAVEEYLDYMVSVRGYSPVTANAYRYTLLLFSELTGIDSIYQVTKETIDRFAKKLVRERKAKVATRSRYFVALRSFMKYWGTYREKRVLSYLQIDIPKSPERKIVPLKKEYFEKIVDSIPNTTFFNTRDRALFLILFSTGMRAHELMQVERDDNQLLEKKEITIMGKGGKVRTVYISDRAADALRDYLIRRTDKSKLLFYGNTVNERMNKGMMTRILKKRLKECGIDSKITLHMLRHLFATELVSNGANIYYIQEMLGHSNISDTAIYMHASNKALKEAHSKFLT